MNNRIDQWKGGIQEPGVAEVTEWIRELRILRWEHAGRPRRFRWRPGSKLRLAIDRPAWHAIS